MSQELGPKRRGSNSCIFETPLATLTGFYGKLACHLIITGTTIGKDAELNEDFSYAAIFLLEHIYSKCQSVLTCF